MKQCVILIIVILTGISFSGFAQSSLSDDYRRPEAPAVNERDIVTVNHIDLYPNPVSDYLNVKIENSTLENVEFELYNIIGTSLEISVEQRGANTYKIDIKDFYPGYYLLIVKDPIKRFNKSYKFQKK